MPSTAARWNCRFAEVFASLPSWQQIKELQVLICLRGGKKSPQSCKINVTMKLFSGSCSFMVLRVKCIEAGQRKRI